MSTKKHQSKLSHDCEFFLVTDIAVYACECTPHHLLIDDVEYIQIENNIGKSLLDFLQDEFNISHHGNTTQVQYCYKDFERAAIRYMQSNTESLQKFDALRKELEECKQAYNQQLERNAAIAKDLEYWAQRSADYLRELEKLRKQ